MMAVLSYYMIRKIFAPALLALFVLWMALALERLLRLVDIVATAGASVSRVIELELYLMPHYLGLALPAALFIGALIGMRSLNEGSELVVMRAAGISLRSLIKPLLFFAVALSILMLIMNGFVKPHSRYAYRAALHDLSSYSIISNIRPGIFQKVNDGMTVRAEAIADHGHVLESVFVAEINASGNARTLATARKAYIRRGENNGASELILLDGRLIRDKEGAPPGKLVFSEYPWPVGGHINEPYGQRGQDEREMTLPELLKGKVKGFDSETPRRKEMSEFFLRLIEPLSLPVLVLLAFPLSLIGAGRAGRAYGLGIGIVLLVLYEKSLGMAESVASAGMLPAYIAVPLPLMILGLGSFAFFIYKTPRLHPVPQCRKETAKEGET